MKILFLTLALLLTVKPAHAAFFSCTYQEQPCDDQGNHYFCTGYGWFSGTFCSATDQTRGPLPPGGPPQHGFSPSPEHEPPFDSSGEGAFSGR